MDDDAPGDPGPGNPNVSDPLEDGSAEHPFDAIQEGINTAVDGDTVLVRDGTYTGTGNRHLVFDGKAITLRSENGPVTCVIDCEHTTGPGLSFGREDLSTLVVGFTVMNSVNHGVFCYRGSPTIVNCIIRDNWSDWVGGGVYSNKGPLTLINCVIAGNFVGMSGGTDPGGGGIGLQSASILVVNCIIVGNHAEGYGGGLRCREGSAPILVNSIVWGNTAAIDGQQVVLYRGRVSPSITFRYSDLQGGPDEVAIIGSGTVVWEDGSIDADPLFVDPNNVDFRLLPNSPCIDAGDTYAVPSDSADLDGDGDRNEATPLDLDGWLRFADRVGTPDTGYPPWGVPVVDMGAYEYQCTGDLNGDGYIQLDDLVVLLARYGMASRASYIDGDLNRDGDVDLSDLAALLAVYGTTCE